MLVTQQHVSIWDLLHRFLVSSWSQRPHKTTWTRWMSRRKKKKDENLTHQGLQTLEILISVSKSCKSTLHVQVSFFQKTKIRWMGNMTQSGNTTLSSHRLDPSRAATPHLHTMTCASDRFTNTTWRQWTNVASDSVLSNG